MPAEIADWMRPFVAAHYKPEPRKKVKRNPLAENEFVRDRRDGGRADEPAAPSRRRTAREGGLDERRPETRRRLLPAPLVGTQARCGRAGHDSAGCAPAASPAIDSVRRRPSPEATAPAASSSASASRTDAPIAASGVATTATDAAAANVALPPVESLTPQSDFTPFIGPMSSLEARWRCASCSPIRIST